MPLYSYICTKCGPDERIVKIAERDAQRCACGRELKRGIDAPGMVWAPTSSGSSHKV